MIGLPELGCCATILVTHASMGVGYKEEQLDQTDRTQPLVFSTEPFCHGACGLQK
jgi:hypothetical protein